MSGGIWGGFAVPKDSFVRFFDGEAVKKANKIYPCSPG
jgi:hypothetical protein